MSITNYGELKTAVASFANLSTDTGYVAQVPTFIVMAESSIRRFVRVLDMLKSESGTMASGVITQPARFIEVRSLKVDQYGVIDYMEPFTYHEHEDWGYPAGYTLDGTKILVAGGGDSDYELAYWQAYAALSSNADTNWLLTNAPDVYLYGALMHGAIWMKDASAALGYKQMFDSAVEAENSRAKAQLFAGPLRARPRRSN